jgi:hypothetical protein
LIPGVVDGIVFPLNLYVEALTPNVTVFRSRSFLQEEINIK